MLRFHLRWKFGNFSMVQQDMSMPLVFGWYPPNANSPLMSSSYPRQEFPQISLPLHGRNDLMFSPAQLQWLASQNEFSQNFETRALEVQDSLPQQDEKDTDKDSFFDCESDESGSLNSKSGLKEDAQLKPNVKVVSKTILQEFDQSKVKLRAKSELPSDRSHLRNSLSPSQSKIAKSRVKKSLSNSDLKITKAPVISSSSFRRVFSPFDSTPPVTKSKRSGSGSRSSSTASLNVEKEKPK